MEPTKSVNQLTEEEKEQGKSARKKPKLELSTSTVIDSTPQRVRLNDYEVEYLRVSLDFHESFASMPDYQGLTFKITQIERITNSVLKDQFDQSYQYFTKNNYHSTRPIRSVYHSTKPENISSIIQSNLSQAKAGSLTDDGWFGKGMYFSPHADYTLMYYSTGKFQHVAAGDSGQILQFDILPGRMLRMKDVKIGGARTPYYDSHVSPNGFEYVMFDSRHVLPRYVVSFQVVQGASKTFHGSIEQVGPHHMKHIKLSNIHSTQPHHQPFPVNSVCPNIPPSASYSTPSAYTNPYTPYHYPYQSAPLLFGGQQQLTPFSDFQSLFNY